MAEFYICLKSPALDLKSYAVSEEYFNIVNATLAVIGNPVIRPPCNLITPQCQYPHNPLSPLAYGQSTKKESPL